MHNQSQQSDWRVFDRKTSTTNDVAAEHNLYIITDEIYDRLFFDDHERVSVRCQGISGDST